MYAVRLLFNINVYLLFLLIVVTLIGDILTFRSEKQILRATFDNATHSIIGGLSWFIVYMNCKYTISPSQVLFDVGLCSAIASFIDLDHFVSARSIYLKDVTNLKHRPPLHCTTILFVICGTLLTFDYIFKLDIPIKLHIIILIAFLSHHTRDATRRGFWLCPFGSTPPIPYYIYVTLICIIPYGICILYDNNILKIRDYSGSSLTGGLTVII